MVDAQGRFRIWATPGFAYLYSRTNQTGSWEITVPEEGELKPLTLPTTKAENSQGSFLFSSVGIPNQPKATKEKPVVGAPASALNTEVGEMLYSQVIVYKTTNSLPVTKADIHIYQNGHLMKGSRHTSPVGAGGPVRDNQQVVTIPHKIGEKYTLEIDADGFEHTEKTISIAQTKEPITIELKPATYVPVSGIVSDAKGVAVPNTRVQVMLKHRDDDVTVPWGPEASTNQRGQFTIEHLRKGDTYRLRIFGPDRLAALTDWTTIKRDESSEPWMIQLTSEPK